jgi:exonuclease SbcC
MEKWEIEEDISELSKALKSLEMQLRSIEKKSEKGLQANADIEKKISAVADEVNFLKRLYKKGDIKTLRGLENRVSVLEAHLSELGADPKSIITEKINSSIDSILADIKQAMEIERKQIAKENNEEVKKIKDTLNKDLAVIDQNMRTQIEKVRMLFDEIEKQREEIDKERKVLKNALSALQNQLLSLNSLSKDVEELRNELSALKKETQSELKKIRSEFNKNLDEEIADILSKIEKG